MRFSKTPMLAVYNIVAKSTSILSYILIAYTKYMKYVITKMHAWVVISILVVTNITTIILWQPFSESPLSGRSITITGSSIIEAEPDEYVFNPYYTVTGTDAKALDGEISSLTKTLVDSIKQLGVESQSITTSVNSYDIAYYSPSDEESRSLYLTITLNDKEMAQKVQDFLVTTSPSRPITPSFSFSTAKQKELSLSAREKALDDARLQAKQTTDRVHSKIGRIIKIEENNNQSITPTPWLYGLSGVESRSSDDISSYEILPGVNKYYYTIYVTYELK
jgi:uncharacterized protein